jgi:predicted transglutaminase-like cysteine proteinase
MTASTAADGSHVWLQLSALTKSAEPAILVALADPPPATVEPAAFESMESVVAPLVRHSAIQTPEHRSDRRKSALASRTTTPSSASSAWGSVGPARFFTFNQVLAKHGTASGGSRAIELASIAPAKTMTDAAPLAEPAVGTEPFGLFTFRAPEGLLWSKWRKVQAAMKADAPAVARCEAETASCTPAAARFAAIVAEAKKMQGRAQLELVNDRVNAAIRYTSDYEQYGVADRWSPPLESFTTGRGDCEDYAIAKYALMRELGVADRDLHVLLVRDNAVHLDHAVLAVRNDGHWLILDNRWNRLTADSDLHQFAPLFALDDEGVKLFAAPYAALAPLNAAPNGDDFIAGANAGDLVSEEADQPPATFAY